MLAIEAENPSLKGVLPKDYGRPALNTVMVGELIDQFSKIAMHESKGEARDILGRVYEYFLAGFAGAEGRRGGEFYTPRSVVRLLVEMLEPLPDKARGIEGRVYDPCCGSGGMFIQSEKFMEEHGGRIGGIAIYGQESNYTTWRLAKMNLAVRGIDADIRWNNEGSFHKDELKDKRFDFILANPPFNISDWGGDRLTRGCALEIWGSAGRQRQLCVAATYPVASGPERNGGGGAGEWIDVVVAKRRGRDPAGDGRGRCGRLHDRAARPAFLLDADSGLFVVPGTEQEPRRHMARPARRSSVHRCAQAGQFGRSDAARIRGCGYREDSERLSHLARRAGGVRL